MNICPSYARSSIAQIRLQENTVLINSKIYSLTDSCKFCGEVEGVEHIMMYCPGYVDVRRKVFKDRGQIEDIWKYLSDESCKNSPQNYVTCHLLLSKALNKRGV